MEPGAEALSLLKKKNEGGGRIRAFTCITFSIAREKEDKKRPQTMGGRGCGTSDDWAEQKYTLRCVTEERGTFPVHARAL